MQVILLAAGYATRLYPLTLHQPKALLPIAGRPLLDWVLDEVIRLEGIEGITLVTNDRFYNAFEAYAASWQPRLPQGGLRVINDGTLSEQTRLGALGDLQLAYSTFTQPADCLVMASDNLFTFDLSRAQQRFKTLKADLILGQAMPDKNLRKRFGTATLDHTGRVLKMVEKDPNASSEWAVYATYFYTADSMDCLKTYLEAGHCADAPGHFPAWLCQQKPVYFYPFEGVCVDIGTPEAYEAVRNQWPPINGKG